MINNRIKHILATNGLDPLPGDDNAILIQGGLDSLMLAMLIIELEQEFKLKIPVIPLVKEHYESIASIEKHLISLGAV